MKYNPKTTYFIYDFLLIPKILGLLKKSDYKRHSIEILNIKTLKELIIIKKPLLAHIIDPQYTRHDLYIKLLFDIAHKKTKNPTQGKNRFLPRKNTKFETCEKTAIFRTQTYL